MSGGEWESAVSARAMKKRAKAAERNKERDAAIRKAREAAEQEEALLEKQRREKLRDSHRIGSGRAGQITFSLEGTSSDAGRRKAARKRTKASKKATVVKESKASVSISPGQLDKVITAAVGRYEEPLLQQKEVTNFIEEQLNTVKKFDPNQQAASFATTKDRPLSFLKQPVQAALSKWIRKQSTKDLQDLLWLLLGQVASSTKASLGSNGNGVRAVLQVIVRTRAGVLYKDKARFRQEMKRYTVHVRKTDLLSTVHPLHAGHAVVLPADVGLFSWLFAQVLDASPREALSLWMTLIQPHVGCKLASPNALKAVVDLGFAAVDAVTEEDGLSALKMDGTAFADGVERLLVLARLQGSGRLPALYEAVRDLCVLGNVGAPQLFLSSYLAHVMPREEVVAAAVQEEAVGTLLSIVSTSHAAYDTWINVYSSHFLQSAVVLEELHSRFSSIAVGDDAKQQMEIALNSFIAKNSTIAGASCKLASGKTAKVTTESTKATTQTCKKLLALTGPHWFGTLLFLLFHWVLAAYVFYVFAGSQLRGYLGDH